VSRTIVVLAAALAAGGARAQAPLVFEARVESVYVDVFVTRDGQPVAGLGAESFEVRDEGVVRPFELLGTTSVPLAAVLAFDVSGSVAGAKLVALQKAGAAFLEGLADSDEASLLTFNEELTWVVPPTTDKAVIARALAGLRPRGGTALYDGLFAASALPSSPARALVAVFSDGEDNISWLDEPRVKDALARSNALVHVVGFVDPPATPRSGRKGQRVTEVPMFENRRVRALRGMAEATGGRFWGAGSDDELRVAFADIAASMRRRYLLRFEPAAGKAGWRRLEVRLKGSKGDVRARPGYWAEPAAAPRGESR
jgi:VWFA-related protein